MGDDRSTANTAMQYHAGRLLALHEGSLPYQVRILCNGILDTVGKVGASDSSAGVLAWVLYSSSSTFT